MIDLSYYPAWFREKHKPQEFLKVLNEIHRLYGKKILLSEIGGVDGEEEETYRLLFRYFGINRQRRKSCIKRDDLLGTGSKQSAVPDRYPLGEVPANLVEKKKLHYTKALSAYKNYRQQGG